MEPPNEQDFCINFAELSQAKIYCNNKRFSRSNKILAEGKYKTVFLGYDHDIGREIAWSAISTQTLNTRDKDKLIENIKIFAKLDHPNLLKIIYGWEDPESNQIITITELTKSSLKQYIRRNMKNIRLKVIKGWGRSVLEAIKYLHSMNIIHGSIKCDNAFIGLSDGNIRLSLLGNVNKHKSDAPCVDFKGLAFLLIEICTQMEIDHSKVNAKHPPREVMMIGNDRVKSFVSACYNGESADSLLAHCLFKPDENDLNPIKLVPVEELYEIHIEEIPKTSAFYITIKRNHENLTKHRFDPYEDVAEHEVETIMSKFAVPQKYFQEILNAIEQQLHKINHITHQSSQSPKHSGPFSIACDSRAWKKQKINFNLGIQEGSDLKKIKLELLYDHDTDTPQSVAELIISHFQLDPSEFNSISKLISDKVFHASESETHSNYSTQDLLELFQEEIHQGPGPNSTMEFSTPSENSPRHSIGDPYNILDLSKSRSLSPIDEESYIVCAKGRKNDPRDVKQLQEALGTILGFRLQSDGVFCQKTEQQVKIFQEDFGLVPNGVVDNKLWATIMKRAYPKHSTNLL